jgi:hypothetical protein
MITQERLKELLDYDAETGLFTWLKPTTNGVRIGQTAGVITCYGYRAIRVDNKIYRAARLVWLHAHGVFPDNNIDHINGLRDDNRLENLRDVTQAENMRNQRIGSRNSSGVLGVGWDKTRSKWRASIRYKGLNKTLGRFTSLLDAVASRKGAERLYGFHRNHGSTPDA